MFTMSYIYTYNIWFNMFCFYKSKLLLEPSVTKEYYSIHTIFTSISRMTF